MPLLSQRREDIPLLAQHFLLRVEVKSNRKVNGFSAEAMELLISAPWLGNIRQLQNVIEQSVALSNGSLINASLVKSVLREKTSQLPSC
jgi:two-component system response regulator GlrR